MGATVDFVVACIFYMNKSGFTLVELIIVIAIIAILITMSIASFGTITKRSRDTRRKSDIEQVRSALEAYRANNKFYPNTGSGSYAEITTLPLEPAYISDIPDDLNTTVHYYYKATNLVSGNYYGYCLSALVETVGTLATGCTANTGQNYTVSNP